MLNRLRPTSLLLLITTETTPPLTMRRNRSLSNLLPVPRRFPRPVLVVVQLVDLLKRHILRLVDEEVHEKHRDPCETAPDPEDVGLRWVESAGEVGGDEGEEPVEEPVGGGGLRVVSICYAIDSDAGSTYHRETLSTSLQRE